MGEGVLQVGGRECFFKYVSNGTVLARQRRNQCVLRLQMAARELEMKLQAWQSEVDDHIHKVR